MAVKGPITEDKCKLAENQYCGFLFSFVFWRRKEHDKIFADKSTRAPTKRESKLINLLSNYYLPLKKTDHNFPSVFPSSFHAKMSFFHFLILSRLFFKYYQPLPSTRGILQSLHDECITANQNQFAVCASISTMFKDVIVKCESSSTRPDIISEAD